MRPEDRDLAQALMRTHRLTVSDLIAGVEAAERSHVPLEDVLVEMNLVSRDDCRQAQEGLRTQPVHKEDAPLSRYPVLDAHPGLQGLIDRMKARFGSGTERFTHGSELGRGGMGRVEEWFDESLQRSLAAKVLIDGSSPRALAHFVAEAQIAAQLEHPNIIPIHELGLTDAGDLYFVMKKVLGEDLQTIVDGLKTRDATVLSTYPLAARMDIFRSICQAVAYAHSRSVVHCDLKPANVMVGDLGEVLVLDWGVARILPGSSSVKDPGDALGIEDEPELIAGTPHFMAPEQFRRKSPSPAADIYALGGLLHALLTGTTPFDMETRYEALEEAVQTRAPEPPSRRAPDLEIGPALDAICLKCLAKSPYYRYSDAGELLEDVKRYQAGLAVAARPEPFFMHLLRFLARHRLVAVVLLVALLALAAGILIGRFQRDGKSRHLAQQAIEEADRLERLAADPATDKAARIRLLLATISNLEEAARHIGDSHEMRSRQAGTARLAASLAQEIGDEGLALYLESLARKLEDPETP